MKLPFLFIAFFVFLPGCQTPISPPGTESAEQPVTVETAESMLAQIASPEIRNLLENALEQTKATKNYTQQYYNIPFPNGDVPAETGACTDVVVRAFRRTGIDLQKAVHEDMKRNFSAYPQKWGIARPDTNIDHRRVPNLQTFFARQGKALPVSVRAENYLPGDIVTWDIDGKGMTHIGLVFHVLNKKTNRYLIIHNMCCGTRLEDRLFEWKITGHYRFF